MRFALLAALAATVYASDARWKQVSCSDVHRSVWGGGWQEGAAASKYCSEWYTTSTITTTVTSTSSVTVTASTSTTTVTVTATCGLPTVTAKARRAPSREGSRHGHGHGHVNPKPSCFASYTAPWAISSACSCLGHTAPTKTVSHKSITTATITKEVKSTATTTPITTTTTTTTLTPASFVLYATPLSAYGAFDPNDNDPLVLFSQPTEDGAIIFSLFSNGTITSDTGQPGHLGEQGDDYNPQAIFFDTLADLTAEGFEEINCTITPAGDGTCPMTCVAPFDGGPVQSLDDTIWKLGTSSAGTEFTPLAIDAGAV